MRSTPDTLTWLLNSADDKDSRRLLNLHKKDLTHQLSDGAASLLELYAKGKTTPTVKWLYDVSMENLREQQGNLKRQVTRIEMALAGQKFTNNADVVRADADFLRILEDSGVALPRQIRTRMVMKCCFHEDGSPSLSVDLEKKLFNCFGCGEKGSLFDFVMKRDSVDFKTALERVATYT